jgi:outer membrane protein OmpA-like peptidoglycan-associated protein
MRLQWDHSAVRIWRAFALAAAALVATACAGVSVPAGDAEVFSLEDGAARITATLLSNAPVAGEGVQTVAVDLFVDEESGEVPHGAVRIESAMLRPGSGRPDGFRLVRLSPSAGKAAHYLIAGTISPESGAGSRYRLRGALKDLRHNRLIGSASVRISAPGLDYSPMAIFRDNPFFDRGYKKDRVSGKSPKAEGPPGFEDYSIQTLALLRAASAAYERDDPAAALSLFTEAASRPDGNTLWTYAGLYLVYEKLGRAQKAEEAFGKIVSISVEKHRMLTVRFLFKVNSVEFWGGPETIRRYEAWTRHIGAYFSRTDHCLKVVGHCSKTGPETWNKSLSLMRAEKVQRMLAAVLPEADRRTRAEGRGSAENVVGIGTDDERDVLDRRVELVIIQCP